MTDFALDWERVEDERHKALLRQLKREIMQFRAETKKQAHRKQSLSTVERLADKALIPKRRLIQR